MSKSKENYFDKFIKDQIRRSEEIKERRERHMVADDVDLKRQLQRRHREKIAHLIRRKTKNG